MKYQSKTVEDYISQLPKDRIEPFKKLRKMVLDNIPDGFEEGILYDMPAFYVPHATYPNGYHVNPELPLPFINFASQKNFIAFYHMGIYSNPKLLEWFTSEYPKYVKNKLDMGKSCIRFKKMDQIPFELLGKLVSKMTVDDWILAYENAVKKK